MKIRIKRKLNEGKGADIIARGLSRNLLSDMVKKILNKFGGLEQIMTEEGTLLSAVELAIGMELDNKEALKSNATAFSGFAKEYEQKKEAIIAKRVQDAEAVAYKKVQEYIDYELERNPGMTWDEILYGPMGGGPYYYVILQQGEQLVKKAKEEPTDMVDEQIEKLYKASKLFLDASRE